jgi:5'-nucleotidase
VAIILLTNDDGYDALGFQSLYRELLKIKEYDVYAVAPRNEQSGASHSLTLKRPIRVEKIRDKFYSIDGTPTDCVMLAYHDLIDRKIDLIISGINHGPNMGSDVFYSGTVAAALQGASSGIKSIAISLTSREYNDFTTAVKYSKDLIRRVLYLQIRNLVLNVNIPEGKINGEIITRMGERIYHDKVIRSSETDDVMYSVIDGVLSYTVDANTDFKAVDEGYVSITPLKLDLTDYDEIAKLTDYLKQ